jgi:serine phosphatase RsbU (regulator of sigma subunit)/CheY-like chemotaxis protein
VSRPTLLLVDDNPANLVALRAVLEPLGHRILEAGSGAEALRYLLTPGIEEDVALILLDVQMPDMDGFETATRIKERERTQEIPIIFLTAHSTDTVAAMRGFETGAVDYLTRPLDAWLLRSKVQVFVDLYEKTRILEDQRELLAMRLDEQLTAEARTLRRLADAAVAINSTRSLDEMLDVINASAREVIRARDAETIVSVGPGVGRARTADLSAISQLAAGRVWQRDRPVRMTREEVQAALADQGLGAIEPGNPVREGWLAVPLMDRTGRRIGLIQVAAKAVGEFAESDELVLLQLAQLASVAVENAERYEHERRIADTLQRSLLPDEPLSVPGVELAAHYQPGSAGTDAGGDWYDAFELFDGYGRRLAVTVGDVMGRGPRAAAVMGQMRTAIRASAVHGVAPVPLFEGLDQLVHGMSGPSMATAVYGVLDLDTRRLELVNAGHPPPLIVPPGGYPRFLELDPGMPLGVDEAAVFKSSSFVLEPGTLVLLYTDGLVESRTVPLANGLAALLKAAATPTDSLDALCTAIVRALVPEGTNDDIALLAIRVS